MQIPIERFMNLRFLKEGDQRVHAATLIQPGLLPMAFPWGGPGGPWAHGVRTAAGLAIGLGCLLAWGLIRRRGRRMGEAALAQGAKASMRALEQEQKQAQERLADLDVRFQHFVEAVRDYAICRLDPDGLVLTWSRGAERIFGYQAEHITGQPFVCLYTREEAALDRPAMDLAQAKALGHWETEGWRVRMDGTCFYALANFLAIRHGGGGVEEVACIVWDVTVRRETEGRIQKQTEGLARKGKVQGEELLERGAMIKGLIEFAPAAIALKNLAGEFLVVNPRMEALLGHSQEDICRSRDRDLFPPGRWQQIHQREERVLGLRQALEVEEQWVHPDGSIHDYLSHEFPLVDALGHCWGLGHIATDITERKQADQAMLRSQEMESLGLLAGGIAHDFNNLLGAMQANLEIARLERSQEDPLPECLQVLGGIVDQASFLVAQMLTYSGRGAFKVEPLDLNRVVEELVHLLRASISRKAVVRYDPDPGVLGFDGDASQIHQLVMNLVMNASEAMDESGGVITLRTGTEILSGPHIRRVYEGQGLEPGPHVSLEVADTGAGMRPEIMKRIFDPFYTTKVSGRGLGLSAIMGIVKGHRGGIRVYSEPGKGSLFKVVLPAGVSGPLASEPAPEEVLEPFRGSGTVLVVDDESAMRAAAVKLLNHAGFDTIQAGDGQEALRLLEQQHGGIRLILMDLTMPRMDGEETYRELRQRGIRIPVILSSGFNEREAFRRFRGQGLAGFLQKPYRFNALLRMVRESLEP